MQFTHSYLLSDKSVDWCNGINVNLFLMIFLVSNKQGEAKSNRVLSKDGQQLMSSIKQVDFD